MALVVIAWANMFLCFGLRSKRNARVRCEGGVREEQRSNQGATEREPKASFTKREHAPSAGEKKNILPVAISRARDFLPPRFFLYGHCS